MAKGYAQHTKIRIKAELFPEKSILDIQQNITYYNISKDSLDKLVFHHWANSYNHESDLLHRELEAHKKTLYLSKEVDKGSAIIQKVLCNNSPIPYAYYKEKKDILEIRLPLKLAANDSIKIHFTYRVKLPNAVFSGYGKTKEGNFNLKYWHVVPAIYEQGKWKAYPHKNLDFMYGNLKDYIVSIKTPKGYKIHSELEHSTTYYKKHIVHSHNGNERLNAPLYIFKKETFENYKLPNFQVKTNLKNDNLPKGLKKSILKRQLAFISNYLGTYSHNKLLLDKNSLLQKNKFDFQKIPKFLNPHSDVFKWDQSLFSMVSKRIIENTFLVDKNRELWFTEGLQTYLIMAYTEQYYPNTKAFGTLSNIWGFRKFHLSKMKYNDLYTFVYQLSARKNLDQALTTRTEKLSNYNRTKGTSFKSGIGFRYIERYLGDSIFVKSLKEYTKNQKSHSNTLSKFQEIIHSNTSKDIDWFFGEYLNTARKIDYTLKNIKKKGDSLYITVKNRRKMAAPVAVYGIRKKKIIWKKWLPPVTNQTTFAVAKGDFEKVSLNYEYLYPELNLRNNWKNVRPKLLERPIQLKWIKDMSDPYYNQIFIKPQVNYNYYDGLILGSEFNNKTILPKNFEYRLLPSYSTKSNNLSGGFSFDYTIYPEESPIYKFSMGMSGSSYHYKESYKFLSLKPRISLFFNRKDLRTPGHNFITCNFNSIAKEIEEGKLTTDEDRYNLLKITYNYSLPKLIHDIRLKTSLELATHFQKWSTDLRYRKLTKNEKFIDLRWYTGLFLNNNTQSDYFSFGLSKPNDYLFEHQMYGRNEDTGFLYQEYIKAEGGFKTFYPENHQRFANQWMSTLNSSYSIWKAIELYGDIGLLKNKHTELFFAYETGIRLNFINDIFEIYLPVYSNNGWEFNGPTYDQKIRFSCVLHLPKIVNNVRRGFF
ncbi:MAG: aminopeptidase [Flavicella sp.]